MIKKIVFFIVAISLTFPSVVNGEYKISRNHLKLTDISSNNAESIEIKNTDLTNKDNVKNLVSDLEKLNNYKPLILSDRIEGDANDVGIVHAAIAKQVLNYGQPGKPPLCILSGGETTVKINNFKGRGGRNSQFLLSLCISLNSEKNIYAIACDTDGIDGLESNAGSLIYPNTLERGIKLGMDAKDYLNRNDSYSYFSKLNDLVITGPTKTNVNDFRALIISN